jgi:hypothetical protein
VLVVYTLSSALPSRRAEHNAGRAALRDHQAGCRDGWFPGAEGPGQRPADVPLPALAASGASVGVRRGEAADAAHLQALRLAWEVGVGRLADRALGVRRPDALPHRLEPRAEPLAEVEQDGPELCKPAAVRSEARSCAAPVVAQPQA